MENEISTITKSKLESYLKIAGVAQSLTKEETDNFLNIAMDFNLNPFKREIYCTSYGSGEYRKTSIIIGYEVYIKRAERTTNLDGWNVITTGSVEANDLKAQITIYRKDRKFPFVHEVDYSEYVQTTYDKETKKQRPNQIWASKPKTMLKKVATAQGFRLCFSDELGGMPYESEELPGTHEREIIIESQSKKIESIPPLNKNDEGYIGMNSEKSYEDAMLDAQEDSGVNLDWDKPQNKDNSDLPEIGTEASKEDVKMYFDCRKAKTNDFSDKFPGLEICKSSTGKYVWQPLGTYKAAN